MRKWIGLLVFLALFIPPYLWPWSYQIVFTCQMLAGVWTVYHWLLDLPKRRQTQAARAVLGSALVVIIFWTVTVLWPFGYTGRTTAIDFQLGGIWVVKFLGSDEQAARGASSYLPTSGAGPISPAGLNLRRQRLGNWRILADFLLGFQLPEPWYQIVYLGSGSAAHRFWRFSLPLWTLVVLGLVPVLSIALTRTWQRLRRVEPNSCRRCGYNLTGNVSGVCSECGTAIPPELQEQLRRIAVPKEIRI